MTVPWSNIPDDAIYAYIGVVWGVNVGIYSIHGVYGLWDRCSMVFRPLTVATSVATSVPNTRSADRFRSEHRTERTTRPIHQGVAAPGSLGGETPGLNTADGGHAERLMRSGGHARL